MPDAKIFVVSLNTLIYGGDAMGRLPDGRAVFVPFSLPGERVRIELLEEKRGYARARLLEVLEPSPRRVQPLCAHFGICGGCQYQHMTYEDQVSAKTSILREQLQRLAGIQDPIVLPSIPNPRAWDYRNTVQFHITSDGRVGYQTAYTNQHFAIQECHLLEDGLDAIWPQLSVEPVPGLERVLVRQGEGEDILLALESSALTPPEFALDLPISAVYLSPLGPIILAGDDYLMMRVLDRDFRVSAGSFFQVNSLQAARMVEYVLSRTPPTRQQTILDLYCGVGLFSAFLAPRAERLVAVESSPSACDDFAANLDEFDQVELYQGQAGQVLPALDFHPGLVVADPPRAGIERAALDAIIRLAPPLFIYISCDPSTLARDLKRLLQAGFQLESTRLFDLFPQTYHIESISILRC